MTRESAAHDRHSSAAVSNAQGADEDLFVSVDEFVAEPVRWFLEVMDGRTVVITRDGVGFAIFEPTVTTREAAADRRARSGHTGTDHDEEAPA